MFGHYGHASETPFKWCFVGRARMARFQWYMDPLVSHQLKETLSELDPGSWTPSEKTFWIRACFLSILRKLKQSEIYVYVDNVEENI